MGTSFMVSKKTLELNPEHSIVKELRDRLKANEQDHTVKDLVWLLFETSLLTSGFSLPQPTVFAGRIHKLVKLGLSIADEEEEAKEGAKGDDDDVPPLEAQEADEGDEMEEVD